ncbi:hypothetical protein CQ010_01300 [Arthrobacter sp. MYb211]|uniref:hypothetical protein n=1 Tax=unclassified Arthrobacter TaxID=235627 RepID=UPI000CFC14A3|nr:MULTISPECIES: hypothetical protein [unclassified Arthrobacter]PRA13310.1 hypothetical protein CQ015_03555 [Arthrobacter sp. MYb221]PRC10507.1 hypothetical protein CQ010_01300 [Arthrobacter sp. MYb211]
MKIDIGGHEVTLKTPENSIITGALTIVTYQFIDEAGETVGGTYWNHSGVTRPTAIGMVRLAQVALENNRNYE